MALDDAKADALAKSSTNLARDARAAIRRLETTESELRAAMADLKADIEHLRASRGITHRLIDLLIASAALQRGLAVALVVVVLALGLVLSPMLAPSLAAIVPSLFGGSRAP